MKTKKTILFAGLIITVLSAFMLSCRNPISLGSKLDIEGPVVEFTAPAARKAVSSDFTIEGTASDNNSIATLILKAEVSNTPFPKQWKYNKGAWELSQDSGANWTAFEGAEWIGNDKSAVWKIPIDMTVNGIIPVDGEYLFTVQAWDKGGFSDDNSFKTLVLIIDRDPPKVDISNPYLYNKYAAYNPVDNTFNDADLQELHAILDDGPERKDPAMIGKFVTQAFPLQWQIEDRHDVWSIDLRMYRQDVEIDQNPGTPLPTGYIYRYWKNLPPPLTDPDPYNTLKPNGAVLVPALDSPAGIFEDGGELQNPITEKATIKLVAVCYDSAGNPNQEKTLGYFVYWPRADEPWIRYSDGMETLDYYQDILASGAYLPGAVLGDLLKAESFMIYPGRNIKVTAFHASGLKEVRYSLYKYDEIKDLATEDVVGLTIQPAPLTGHNNVLKPNDERPPVGSNNYPTIFPWEFTPPNRTGYYMVKAEAWSNNPAGTYYKSVEYEALFRVQDISFPDFPVEPKPEASEPLFQHITNNTITISGIVSDATEIESLTMVWINAISKNYAAMSQLQYFRDSTYQGWADATNIPGTQGTALETDSGIVHVAPLPPYPYDTRPGYQNRLWKINPVPAGQDGETGRQLYSYSVTIELTDELKIGGINGQPLRSQVFLLRAENPDKKCTIITYAPQGDTLAPTIKISETRVIRQGQPDVICKPGEFQQVPKFVGNEVIRVTGVWEEDSSGYLDVETYLYPNMEFKINGVTMSASNAAITMYPASGKAVSGTFTIEATVKATGTPATELVATSMTDTLVVDAKVTDIGGNPTEESRSWLIESETLRFLRISSLDEDQAYKAGFLQPPRNPGEIEIYLEFNKPVRLKPGRSAPVLMLNSGGKAVYKAGQVNENTRQFFTYTVGAGDNTPAGVNLNVNGLSLDGTNPVVPTQGQWAAADYPFTWINTGLEGKVEEVRLTRTNGHDGAVIQPDPPGDGYYVRALPVTTTTTDSEYPFTLIGGKRITIDNTAPTLSSISFSPAGWHTAGPNSYIYIVATFNEPVKVGVSPPQLTLGYQGNNNIGTTSTGGADDIRVTGSQITFRYNVQANTNGNQLTVTGLAGDILDIPGNRMTSLVQPGGTQSGVYLDTVAPNAPTVAVYGKYTADSNYTTLSATPAANLYYDNMYVNITGATGALNLGTIEYSTNGGENWIPSTSTPIRIPTITTEWLQNGDYTIQARQIDQAGNVSPTTSISKFTLNKGSLVTRIDSTTQSGLYSNNTTINTINITVYFRIPLTFTGSPTITLNARRGTQANFNDRTAIPVTTAAASNVQSLSFTYQIQGTDNTPTGLALDVTGLSFTATDAGGVPVNTLASTLPTDTTMLLRTRRDIRVQTGALTITTQPAFISGTVATDGSFEATLRVVFNRNIIKNTGDIVITQSATGYRLPAVLTETQRNKYRGIPNFDSFYTRGTNGFNATAGASDTSTKYILRYDINTADLTGLSDIVAVQTFANLFRQGGSGEQGEKVTIPVTSSAVTITNITDGTGTLNIALTGGNALQVPGATYEITIPASLVRDALDNLSPAPTTTSLTAGGVARPFVRVRKTQDTIVIRTGGALASRIRADQPLTTEVRLDCRTPGTTIYYFTGEQATNVSYAAADTAITDQNWTAASTGNPPADTTSPAAPGQPADPQDTTTGRQTYSAPITIGTVTGANYQAQLNNVQGLQWRIRAKANSGGNWSADSQEMAYRSVLTYRITTLGTQLGQNLGNGDQIWIRGGDAIGSSSIPGFPLTWEDNWETLKAERKRAGIRVLDLAVAPTGGTGQTNLNGASTWRWVTWEINVPTYFDFIMGHDADSDEANVTQYGPLQYAYQRAGWTSYKDYYRMNPGKHRWMYVAADAGGAPGNTQNKGSISFALPFMIRPAMDQNGEVTYP